jgi:hypothetical protein
MYHVFQDVSTYFTSNFHNTKKKLPEKNINRIKYFDAQKYWEIMGSEPFLLQKPAPMAAWRQRGGFSHSPRKRRRGRCETGRRPVAGENAAQEI